MPEAARVDKSVLAYQTKTVDTTTLSGKPSWVQQAEAMVLAKTNGTTWPAVKGSTPDGSGGLTPNP